VAQGQHKRALALAANPNERAMILPNERAMILAHEKEHGSSFTRCLRCFG
jgi:hypothetical protein